MRHAAPGLLLLSAVLSGCSAPRAVYSPKPTVTPVSPGQTSTRPSEGSGDEATAAEAWRDQLGVGTLVPHVEPVMTLQEGSTVTATIYGDKAPAPPAAGPGDGAPVPLKVSSQMIVSLSAPGNKDQFDISPAEPQEHMVLHDQSTVWTWSVTPLHEGDGVLQIDAYVLYRDDANHRIQLPSKRINVHVRSIPGKTFLKRGWEWVQEHPGEALKYILPGGAGAAMVRQLWLWWRRRRKKIGERPEDAPDAHS